MAKKQINNPLVKRDKDNLPYFVSPNRKTFRVFKAKGLETERVSGPRAEAPANKKELKVFMKELARKHGSQTGKLKKKHINRERILQENV